MKAGGRSCTSSARLPWNHSGSGTNCCTRKHLLRPVARAQPGVPSTSNEAFRTAHSAGASWWGGSAVFGPKPPQYRKVRFAGGFNQSPMSGRTSPAPRTPQRRRSCVDRAATQTVPRSPRVPRSTGGCSREGSLGDNSTRAAVGGCRRSAQRRIASATCRVLSRQRSEGKR